MEQILSFFNGIISANGVAWFVGQILGIIAIILGFISYQVKTQKQLLFMQTSVAAVFGVHYLLIGAYSGMAMNAVGIVRNYAACDNLGAAIALYEPVVAVVLNSGIAVCNVCSFNCYATVQCLLRNITCEWRQFAEYLLYNPVNCFKVLPICATVCR